MLLHPVFVAWVNCMYSFLCGLWLYESMVLSLKGTAGLITLKLLKQVLFLPDNLCRAGLLELWPWEFHNGWDENCWNLSSEQAYLIRVGGAEQLRRFSQAQLPRGHWEPWCSFITTLRHASGITPQLSCIRLGNTREQQNMWWKKLATVNYWHNLLLMVRMSFFWIRYWCLKASISLIPILLNRRKALKVHVQKNSSVG